MKRGSTLFLKIVVLLMGIAILAACVIPLPLLATEVSKRAPEFTKLLYPILMTVYITVIPFFIGLYQAIKVLTFIDKKVAFSERSVHSLKWIKYCAIIISSLYVLCLPLFYFLADKTDAPGIMIIGLILTFASIVIATFAAVLQRLLQEAISIKSENDLTV
ncbi:membrane protein [Listeria weihenstephanensis]|uniref:Membrane protein n=1 Tax=Listeria weihenstephanensis TaxID=1006155 RepID=A0A1S7FUB4_9LIST|nr:DUF2975 domain-containing protein [Listeria weihenstephanensis]AQY51041.1 membrane protein [Listeria weihenstephanensis]